MGSAAAKSRRFRTSDSARAAPVNKSAAMQIAVIKSCGCAVIKNEIIPKLLKQPSKIVCPPGVAESPFSFANATERLSGRQYNFLLDRNIIETIGVSHK